jgi:hypothetical protein
MYNLIYLCFSCSKFIYVSEIIEFINVSKFRKRISFGVIITVKNGLMCTRFNVQVAFLGTCPVLIAKVTFFDTTAD